MNSAELRAQAGEYVAMRARELGAGMQVSAQRAGLYYAMRRQYGGCATARAIHQAAVDRAAESRADEAGRYREPSA